MVANRIEYAAVDFTFRLRPSGAGRSVTELGRTRSAPGPLCQLTRGCIAKSIVQPHCPQPTITLGVWHANLLGPLCSELRYPLNMFQPRRRDDGPLWKSGP
jgi:hypothetical protein